jgi:hypothetical protein
MRKIALSGVGTLSALLLVLAFSALAGGGTGDRGVIRQGMCTAGSTSKLKAKLDDGRIETEFEVVNDPLGPWVARMALKTVEPLRTMVTRQRRPARF